MRFFIHLALALAFLSSSGIFAGNIANAAGKKSTLQSDLDNGMVVCMLNSQKKIICNCKQGTQACTDMIENSCGKGGASCAGGYCSCEAKDSFLKANPFLRPKSVGSGTAVTTPPAKPKTLRDRQKTTAPANNAVKRN